jgi:hypothetical protein
MLLAASSSNHHLIIGVRPRAVTTPAVLRSLSGTWAKMSSRREDLSLKPPTSATASTRACGATKKAHWLSTVRLPGPRANLNLAAPWLNTARLSSPSTHNDQSPIAVPPVSTGTETTATSTPVVVAAVPSLPPARPESPLAHARRGAVFNVPPPCVVSSDTTHTLSIALPRPGGAQLAPEMVTVSVRRGGRLVVVADAWHLEHDCEWRFCCAGASYSLCFRQVIMSGMLRCPLERSIWAPYGHALARMGLWLSMYREGRREALASSETRTISQKIISGRVESLLLVSERSQNRPINPL